MRRIIYILNLILIINMIADAQVMRRRVSGTVAPPELLLDNNAAGAAYSLRKLRTDYAGSAIRVRRDNDDAEQDIGFDVNGSLDTTSLKSFVGANNGFVKTWYDQTANAYDGTQATTTKQPTVIASGAVVRENGKPAMSFDGVRYLSTSSSTQSAFKPLWDGSNAAVMCVVNYTTTGLKGIIGSVRGTSSLVGYDMWANTTDRIVSFAPNGANTDNLNQSNNGAHVGQSLIIDLVDADNATAADRSKIYVNNGAAIQNNAGTGAVSTNNSGHPFALGGLRGDEVGSVPWVGTIQEVVVWLSDQTANLTSIKSNVNGYYSIY